MPRLLELDIFKQSDEILDIGCKFDHKENWEVWSFVKRNGGFEVVNRFESGPGVDISTLHIVRTGKRISEMPPVSREEFIKTHQKLLIKPLKGKLDEEFYSSLDEIKNHQKLRLLFLFE